MAYADEMKELFDFSQVNEIFQTSQSLLYLRTKIEFENEFLLILQQEEQEIIEMKFRNIVRSTSKEKGDKKQLSSNEFLRVDMYLDG